MSFSCDGDESLKLTMFLLGPVHDNLGFTRSRFGKSPVSVAMAPPRSSPVRCATSDWKTSPQLISQIDLEIFYSFLIESECRRKEGNVCLFLVLYRIMYFCDRLSRTSSIVRTQSDWPDSCP